MRLCADIIFKCHNADLKATRGLCGLVSLETQARSVHTQYQQAVHAALAGVDVRACVYIGCFITPLTFARHRLSPLAAFASGTYFLHNGRQ